MVRQVEAGSGYASESMLPVHFGLGSADRIDAVEITWPSGFVQRIEGADLNALAGVNRLVRIEESGELNEVATTTARAFTRATAEATSGAPTRLTPNGPPSVFENGRDARRRSRF